MGHVKHNMLLKLFQNQEDILVMSTTGSQNEEDMQNYVSMI